MGWRYFVLQFRSCKRKDKWNYIRPLLFMGDECNIWRRKWWVCGVRKQQELVISILKTVSMFALPLFLLSGVGESCHRRGGLSKWERRFGGGATGVKMQHFAPNTRAIQRSSEDYLFLLFHGLHPPSLWDSELTIKRVGKWPTEGPSLIATGQHSIHASRYILTLWSPVVTICTTRFNISKLCILPTQYICVFRMHLTTKRINRLVVVGTQILNII
jgi:hypothetical protein